VLARVLGDAVLALLLGHLAGVDGGVWVLVWVRGVGVGGKQLTTSAFDSCHPR
jgi:hypothetical protein